MAPVLIASRRLGSVRAIVGCSLNVDGQLSSCSLSATSFSARTAVSITPDAAAPARGIALRVGRARSSSSPGRCALQLVGQRLVGRLHVVFRHDALAHEPRAEDLARRRMLG